MRTLAKTLALLVLLSGTAHQVLATEEVLRGRILETAPFAFKDDSGRWQGLIVDLVTALAEEAGYQPQFHTLPWARAIEELKLGHIDIMASLTRTREREAFINFIGVSRYEQIGIIVQRNHLGLKLETVDDFMGKGLLWGIHKDTIYSEALNARLESDPQFRTHFIFVAKPWLAPQLVEVGHITGTFREVAIAGYEIGKYASAEKLGVLTSPVFPANPVYFGLTKKASPDKLKRVQDAYWRLEERGVLEEIREKWQEPLS